MHIGDGILTGPALAAGWGLGAAGVAYGLKRMAVEQVPRVAVLSAAFFTASFIHIPLPGSGSVHLMLPGLLGLVLGWSAFPAVLVALFLQALMFHFGGLTALGANTFVMAAPAVACYCLFNRMARARSRSLALLGAGAAGAIGVILAFAFHAAFYLGSREAFRFVPAAELLPHAILAGTEMFITAATISFLRQVRPDVLALSDITES